MNAIRKKLKQIEARRRKTKGQKAIDKLDKQQLKE
jgi:hypothetical protein